MTGDLQWAVKEDERPVTGFNQEYRSWRGVIAPQTCIYRLFSLNSSS